jgi:hypothetical protein
MLFPGYFWGLFQKRGLPTVRKHAIAGNDPAPGGIVQVFQPFPVLLFAFLVLTSFPRRAFCLYIQLPTYQLAYDVSPERLLSCLTRSSPLPLRKPAAHISGRCRSSNSSSASFKTMTQRRIAISICILSSVRPICLEVFRRSANAIRSSVVIVIILRD